MIAAWKSVDVSYGVCYALMLMDESIFEKQFSALQDGKSTWHLLRKTRRRSTIQETADARTANN